MTPTQFRTIRARCKLDTVELAKFLGISKAAVSRYESGDRPIPGPVWRLMLLLDESSGRLFSEKISEWS